MSYNLGFGIADCGFVESLRSINYNGPFDTKVNSRSISVE